MRERIIKSPLDFSSENMPFLCFPAKWNSKQCRVCTSSWALLEELQGQQGWAHWWAEPAASWAHLSTACHLAGALLACPWEAQYTPLPFAKPRCALLKLLLLDVCCTALFQRFHALLCGLKAMLGYKEAVRDWGPHQKASVNWTPVKLKINKKGLFARPDGNYPNLSNSVLLLEHILPNIFLCFIDYVLSEAAHLIRWKIEWW